MKDFIESIINTGNYKLIQMEERIKHLYICGDLTAEEMNYLLLLAAEKASDNKQIDLYEFVIGLEKRIEAIECKGITVWTTENPITLKGQTRLYDIDKDNILDYVRYDGGRESTSLSPGKINGWVKTDANGNVTHTIERDENGEIILVPVNSEDNN